MRRKRRVNTNRTMTYKRWLKSVDDCVWSLRGVSVHDLPDCTYNDWYEDGVDDQTAARRAIRQAF